MRNLIAMATLVLCLFAGLAFAKTPPTPFPIDSLWQKLEADIKTQYADADLANAANTTADPHLQLYVALSAIRQNNLKDGAKILQSAPTSDEYADLCDYGTAVILMARSRPDEAWPNLERLTVKYPQDPDVIFLQSRFLAEKDNLLGAIDVLNTNLSLKQKQGETHLQRGLLNTLIFNYEGALKDFRLALKDLGKDQTHYRQMAYFQAGLIELKYNNNEKRAASYFKQGKKINPQSELVQQLEQGLK